MVITVPVSVERSISRYSMEVDVILPVKLISQLFSFRYEVKRAKSPSFPDHIKKRSSMYLFYMMVLLDQVLIIM